jgi:hypothetical protein
VIIQYYQAGFQSGKSLTDQLFALSFPVSVLSAEKRSKQGGYQRKQKTKYMIAAFGGKPLEVVKEFVCLGFLVTPKNDESPEIQKRIKTANR